MANTQNQKTSHQHKDTLFRTLFGDNKNFLELYNAVANENLPNETEVALYKANELLAKFNDLAGSIGNQLIVFFEHQSTFSENMPLRLLSYVTEMLYLRIVDKDKLYSGKRVMIPTPKFYVLYNGEEKLDVHELRLSDAFLVKDTEPAMELVAKIIDINPGNGDIVLNRSENLKGYSYLVEKIRNNQSAGMTRDDAIATAIKTCIDEDVLKEFLTKRYTEVLKMLNWEYDAEAERRVIAQEAEQRGEQRGEQKGERRGERRGVQRTATQMLKLLQDGMSPEDAFKQVTARYSDTLPQ